jgi:uncharacterized protein YciI
MPLYVRTLLVTGPTDEVAPAAEQHRAQLRQLAAAGKLHSAGEFKDGDGFLEIIRADDLHEAQSIAGASPLVEAGLGTWMLREWTELDL